MTRLIQIKKGNVRRVALVEEPHVRLLAACSSIYELAQFTIDAGKKLSEVAREKAQNDALDYDLIYSGRSEWRLLPAIDHPVEPTRCLLSVTGLTHLGSARDRQSMHATANEDLTDSMKIFRWGVEGGRPDAGRIGIPPEWFHKGTGTSLRAHVEPLDIPPFAEDGGEEAEIAGAYIVARDGRPYRIGMPVGNEFSDPQFEKKNYLYLAGSKLRTGESEVCYRLQNIEHHHFKFDTHRRPGDVHVHFFATDCLSFSDHVRLQNGDVMQVAAEGFGRPLCSPVRVDNSTPAPINVFPLG
jgi:hypothetical protein